MDLNRPFEFVPSSTTTSQVVDNFTPIAPVKLSDHHPTNQEDEDKVRNFRFIQILRRNLEMLRHQQIMDIYNHAGAGDFKSQQQLPLARIKKVMKSNPEVKIVSAETPVLFSKECEIFILELTLRAWLQTADCGRRTLQICDIAWAIKRDAGLHFLHGSVHCCQSDHYGSGKNEYRPNDQQSHCTVEYQPPYPVFDMNANPVTWNKEVPDQLLTKPQT